MYAFALLPGLTAMRDSISLTVYYGAKLDFRGSTVIALSQSGQTPDVLEYVTRARSEGAFTIGITNHEDSDLAQAADALLPLAAGDELAVAATKTYSNTLAALALFAGAARRSRRRARSRSSRRSPSSRSARSRCSSGRSRRSPSRSRRSAGCS